MLNFIRKTSRVDVEERDDNILYVILVISNYFILIIINIFISYSSVFEI